MAEATFSKKVIVDMYSKAAIELRLVAIPYLSKLISGKADKFTSQPAEFLIDGIIDKLNYNIKKADFISDLCDDLNGIEKIIPAVQDLADVEMQEVMYGDTMTAKQLTLAQLAVTFYNLTNSITNVVDYLLACEINAKNPEAADLEQYMSSYSVSKRNESTMILRWILNKFHNAKASDIIETINVIPNVVLNSENKEVVEQLHSKNKIMPFALEGFFTDYIAIPIFRVLNFFITTPIMSVYSVWTEYGVRNYKLQIERKRMLEYRLLELKGLEAGQNDLKLAKEISYTQDRISDLEYSISEYVKDL